MNCTCEEHKHFNVCKKLQSWRTQSHGPSVANRCCRHHSKAESGLERNTSTAESERPVKGKGRGKLNSLPQQASWY